MSQKAFSALIKAKETFEQLGFELTLLTKDETEKLFEKYDNAVLSENAIETGIKSIVVVRLLKAPFQEFHLNQWFNALWHLFTGITLFTFLLGGLMKQEPRCSWREGLSNINLDKLNISSQAQGELTQEFILDNFQTGSQVLRACFGLSS